MVTGRMGHISVFCSYAREDESVRELLEEKLAALRANKVIDDWYDSRIKPGARWDDEIKEALEQSRLVIFLVTPELLASEYVNKVEIPHSIERERAGKCHVVPIVIKAAEWGNSPLADFQALPGDARPIDSFSDPGEAWSEVTAGIQDACKRIVDWSNPYIRAQVGDWNHAEQTARLPDGRSITIPGTSELIEKTETEATVLVQVLADGKLQESRINIDLTEPLENRMGDIMKQMGQDQPANLETWIGPAQYEEDFLTVGGTLYECVKSTRLMRIEQRGEKLEGTLYNWYCIDVTLDGIVKGSVDLGVWSQSQILLGYGHAGTPKPNLAEGVQEVPSAIFAPGRWQITMTAFGGGAEYDLFLHPNGVIEGGQAVMGTSVPIQGQWGFDTTSNMLNMNLVAMVMGMPAGQDYVQVQLADSGGGMVTGVDGLGRQFALRRIG